MTYTLERLLLCARLDDPHLRLRSFTIAQRVVFFAADLDLVLQKVVADLRFLYKKIYPKFYLIYIILE